MLVLAFVEDRGDMDGMQCSDRKRKIYRPYLDSSMHLHAKDALRISSIFKPRPTQNSKNARPVAECRAGYVYGTNSKLRYQSLTNVHIYKKKYYKKTT